MISIYDYFLQNARNGAFVVRKMMVVRGWQLLLCACLGTAAADMPDCSAAALSQLLSRGPSADNVALAHYLQQYNSHHARTLRSSEQRFVLMSVRTGELGRQDGQLGVYMKAMASAFMIALVTNRSVYCTQLLLQQAGY